MSFNKYRDFLAKHDVVEKDGQAEEVKREDINTPWSGIFPSTACRRACHLGLIFMAMAGYEPAWSRRVLGEAVQFQKSIISSSCS